jgi:hypothetical protein
MHDAPTLTGAAVACRSCSAPLAPDQRYCLACGTRVAAPRVAFLDVLAAGEPAAPAASAAAQRAAGGSHTARSLARQLDRVGGPMGAAAVVLVALGVGFLIGHGGSGGGPSTVIQRPPVVNVQSSGTAAAPTDPTATGTGATGTKGGKAKRGDTGTKGVPKATSGNTGGDLNKLQAQPKEQATQGAPPKQDNKASGGGSAKETIG